MKFNHIEGVNYTSDNREEHGFSADTDKDTRKLSFIEDRTNDMHMNHNQDKNVHFNKESYDTEGFSVHNTPKKNVTSNPFSTFTTGKNLNKRIIGSGTISTNPTRICVMGIGGGGVNATNMMVLQKLKNVDIIAANTDIQTLTYCLAENVLPLGQNLSGGLGAGGNPLRGAEAAKDAQRDIYECVKQYDMLFLAAGLGGGTGTGATPIIAEIAKRAGVLTIGVVTLPFSYEGNRRISIAEYGLEELESVIDALIVIPNDNILGDDLYVQDMSVDSGFKIVDGVLAETVRSISDIITVPSTINIDFADIKNCLQDAGRIAVGFGKTLHTEERKPINANKVVEDAFSNTVISKENISIMNKARCIIANTVTGPDISMNDYQVISDMVVNRAGNTGKHAFKHGYRVEKDWGSKIQVTIIASQKEVVENQVLDNMHTYDQNKSTEKMHMTAAHGHASEHEHEKEEIPLHADYVKHDVFDKIFHKGTEIDAELEVFHGKSMDIPAVNRLLDLN